MIKILLLVGIITWSAYSPVYASSSSLLISKSFLGVPLTDTQTSVSVDGQLFSPERVISVGDVPDGLHTLFIQVPQGTKLFYTLCNMGSFIDAGVGPAIIKVSFEVKGSCRMSLVFTPPQMINKTEIVR